MEISNINDLSGLIMEKEKVYTFRKLEQKDAKDIQMLMTKSFIYDNQGIKLLQVTEEDRNTEFNLKLYDWMIQENLSFGAFHGGQLVSACLTYDLSSNNDLNYEGPEPSQVILEIQELVGFLLGKYADTKILPKKKLLICFIGQPELITFKNNQLFPVPSCKLKNVKSKFHINDYEAAHIGTALRLRIFYNNIFKSISQQIN